VTEGLITVSAPFTTKSRSLQNFTVATFTHADGVEPASAFVATIDWGDGTTSQGIVTMSGSTYSVVGSHTYQKGTGKQHTISATVLESGMSPNGVLPSVVFAGAQAGPTAPPIALRSNSSAQNEPVSAAEKVSGPGQKKP
jgi:hypothetical protein